VRGGRENVRGQGKRKEKKRGEGERREGRRKREERREEKVSHLALQLDVDHIPSPREL